MNVCAIHTLVNARKYYYNLEVGDKMIINNVLCVIISITFSKSIKNGFRKFYFIGIDSTNKKHKTLIPVYAK